MVNDSFRNRRRKDAMRHEVVQRTLQGRGFGSNLGGGLGVFFEPFFDCFDLFSKVDSGRAKGWRVEASFFESNGSISRKLVSSAVVQGTNNSTSD